MNPSVQIYSLVFSILFAAIGFCGDDSDAKSLESELASLQGSWLLVIDVNGQSIRNVKTIKGNQETVRRYDSKTKRLLSEHKAEFELSQSGDVRVLTFRSATEPKGDSLSYVYKIDGKFLFEITGILTENHYKNNVSTPRLLRWERIEAVSK
jgi:hypothetical protein